ncbi:MAG: hypothetical protein RI101_05235 [Nitrospira sp.]|nr:hypothetical protein [Nitrospira sp.]
MTTLDPHDFNQPSLKVDRGTFTKDFILLAGGAIVNGLKNPTFVQPAAIFDAIFKGIPSNIFYDEFYDPDVTRWSNVIFADNYFQEAAKERDALTFTPNGRALSGFEINAALSGIKNGTPGRALFTQDDFSSIPLLSLEGIGGPHSRVWRWYAGTVDLSLPTFEFTSAKGEPIFRNLYNNVSSFVVAPGGALGTNVSDPFKGSKIPWYVAHEYPHNGLLTFPFDRPDSVWEGIGEGWAFSPGGGVQFLDSSLVGRGVQFDNTDGPMKAIVHPNGEAIETIFNGNFEHGNLHRAERFPSYETSTPGWSLHQSLSAQLTTSLRPVVVVPKVNASGQAIIESNGLQGHAAFLDDLFDSQIVHNRLFISPTAQALQFDFMLSAELGGDGQGGQSTRTPDVRIFARIDGQDYELGPKVTPTPIAGQSGWFHTEVSLIARQDLGNPQSPSVDLHGKVTSLSFRLSMTGTLPIVRERPASLLLDNIALRLPGSPIMAEAAAQPNISSEVQIAQSVINPFLAVAAAQWSGLSTGTSNLIEFPDGIAGSTAGLFMVSAPDFSFDHVAASGKVNGSQQGGHTGSCQGSLDNQRIFADIRPSIAGDALDERSSVNQSGLNGNASLASNSHAVYSQPDTDLTTVQSSTLLGCVIHEDASLKADIVEYRSFIDNGVVSIMDFNVGLDSSAPSGKGAIANSEIFDVQKFSLEPFQLVPVIVGHGCRSVRSNPLFNAAPHLSNSDSENQGQLQHSPSFGSQTVPTDRNLVNNSEAISSQPSALSFDQLALLSKATITIADLADGYLALTTGTTITLDTDAAGYGLFVDPTPFLNEEWRPRETSNVKGETSETNGGAWEFTALDVSAAVLLGGVHNTRSDPNGLIQDMRRTCAGRLRGDDSEQAGLFRSRRVDL